MFELDLAIANSQWLEELGRWANGDSHDEGIQEPRNSRLQTVEGARSCDPSARRATELSISNHRLLLCDSGHQDACWNGILDPVSPSAEVRMLKTEPYLVIAPR
jgi:hypothetical protein